MSEPSNDKDRASDEGSKEEPAATSGEAEVHRVDTVPPPATGDAYSADTVIRDVPPEALDAIRDKRQSSEKQRVAAIAGREHEPEPKKPEAKKEEAPKQEAAEAEQPKMLPPQAPAKPETKSPPHASVVHEVAPPVTSGELMIAFAAAVALIVIAFYAIGSAF